MPVLFSFPFPSFSMIFCTVYVDPDLIPQTCMFSNFERCSCPRSSSSLLFPRHMCPFFFLFLFWLPTQWAPLTSVMDGSGLVYPDVGGYGKREQEGRRKRKHGSDATSFSSCAALPFLRFSLEKCLQCPSSLFTYIPF